MKLLNILLAAAIKLTAVRVVTAANCGEPAGSYTSTYVPTGRAWNSWQYGIGEMTTTYASLKQYGFVVVSGTYKMVELQKDTTGSSTTVSYARDAYNNIWAQCMDNGYNCAASYKTGAWSYAGQWYWGWWNRDSWWARDVRHCGLGGRSAEQGEGGDPLGTWNETVPTILSITTTNVTRDELPFPEMFAGKPDDKLYPLITVELDWEE